MACFADVGLPYPLFEAEVQEASGYRGFDTCLLCQREHVHCFKPDAVLMVCSSCAIENELSTEILQEFPFFRDMMTEAEAKGKAEGLREAASLGLENRVGTLSEDVQAALGQADEQTIKAILAHIASDSLEQLYARLGLNNT